MSRLLIPLVVVLVAASCGGGGDTDSQRVRSTPLSPTPVPTFAAADGDPTPGADETGEPGRSRARVTVTPSPAPTDPPSQFDRARIKLTRVATLDEPLAMATRSGDNSTLYVAEKGGRIRALRAGQSTTTVLDISGEVSTGSEQGLLGLAFSPDGRYLYVNFTDPGGDSVVREYDFSDGQADTDTARAVLTLDQPYGNHNGGNITFGPDRRLYVGFGDGGSGGDPRGNAQNLEVLLGKMLRIDPRPSGGREYSIPSDNPFVGRSGRDEIWAYGLRNPWRWSFDRDTGDLYIGDVGQNSWEEVSFAPASSDGGENYGWDAYEGTHRFENKQIQNHHPPIYEYPRESGNCAVTGGYVYRGRAIPDLRGAYVFADYCAGVLHGFVQRDGRVTDYRSLDAQTERITSFGEDQQGEMYVLSQAGGVYRIEGA